MDNPFKTIDYRTELPAGSHWSLRLRRGTMLRLDDIDGTANVGMLLYNPENLLERYNAPDTLKCQHTFRLGQGHCLYSDMGRIFASIVEDSFGWHDTICGNSHASHVARWGTRDYQSDRNDWLQNGHDAMLVELAKYGLSLPDLASNVNWFSKVTADEHGRLQLEDSAGQAGSQVVLRIEMSTLVILHTCPHPMCTDDSYPTGSVRIELGTAPEITGDDLCLNHCDENRRGFLNNRLYHLGTA